MPLGRTKQNQGNGVSGFLGILCMANDVALARVVLRTYVLYTIYNGCKSGLRTYILQREDSKGAGQRTHLSALCAKRYIHWVWVAEDGYQVEHLSFTTNIEHLFTMILVKPTCNLMGCVRFYSHESRSFDSITNALLSDIKARRNNIDRARGGEGPAQDTNRQGVGEKWELGGTRKIPA